MFYSMTVGTQHPTLVSLGNYVSPRPCKPSPLCGVKVHCLDNTGWVVELQNLSDKLLVTVEAPVVAPVFQILV